MLALSKVETGCRRRQPLPVMCHPERKNAKRFAVEVLRRRSKTEERSDEGVYEGAPITFFGEVTFIIHKDMKKLS